MPQPRYALFFLLLGLLLVEQGCRYPAQTLQARAARKKARAQAKIDKRLAAALQDSLAALPPADTSSATPGKPARTAGKGKGDPNRTGKARTDSTQLDSLSQVPLDSLGLQSDSLGLDSLAQGLDSIPSDSSRSNFQGSIRLSRDSLDVPVKYEATDSMIYDLVDKKIYLYGQAKVVYQSMNLEAYQIVFDFETNVATATGRMDDSLGRLVERPKFTDKDQSFESRRIEYNFKSKKGKVYDAATTQGDGYFLSKSTKFISKTTEEEGRENDVIYSGGCTYTTCNHLDPHFGIRSARAKVVPNKLIVVGPSYLEIMGTPTPLALPFGFFPITKGRRSGLILSTDIEQSSTLGMGLRGIGYYFGLNDYTDLALTADLYVRGSWRVRAASRYKKRYRYDGSLRILYSNQNVDERGTPDFSVARDFRINWTHRQDQKAHPSQSFSAKVDIGTGSVLRNTQNDAASVLTNTLTSSIVYEKRFLGTPFSLSLGMDHQQNTQTRAMTINLPVFNFTMNQIFPFKRKEAVGKERWYERVTFSYAMNATNRLVTTDTALFAPGGFERALEDLNYGIQHSPNVNLSLKLFKYINVQPSIQYSERWYFARDDRAFDPTLIIAEPDTLFDANGDIEQIVRDTTFGTVEEQRTRGFFPLREVRAGVSFNTNVFATLYPKIGGLHAVRSIITPNISFNWRPDYSDPRFGYYDRVQLDTRYPDETQLYNRFANGIFGAPGAGQQGQMAFSLTNRTEAKLRNLQDTTGENPFRKSMWLNNFVVNGNYNFIADSLKLSTINMSGNTILWKTVNARFNLTFDPYIADTESNRRLDVYEWAANRRLARLTAAQLNLSTSLTSGKIRKWFSGEDAPKGPSPFDILQSLNVNYNWSIRQRYINGVDSLEVSANELSLNGSLQLTDNWTIRVGRIGYDFSRQRITYPDLSFARLLHCWELGMNWQPERRTWTFFLRVRPSSLGFIKLEQRKQIYDTF